MIQILPYFSHVQCTHYTGFVYRIGNDNNTWMKFFARLRTVFISFCIIIAMCYVISIQYYKCECISMCDSYIVNCESRKSMWTNITCLLRFLSTELDKKSSTWAKNRIGLFPMRACGGAVNIAYEMVNDAQHIWLLRTCSPYKMNSSVRPIYFYVLWFVDTIRCSSFFVQKNV